MTKKDLARNRLRADVRCEIMLGMIGQISSLLPQNEEAQVRVTALESEVIELRRAVNK